MDSQNTFRALTPKPQSGLCTSNHVASGIPIPKTRRVELFSDSEWEEFTEEWASSLQASYVHVVRFAGAGDQGLDVLGFVSDNTFAGGWDNYQCKHYVHALRPSDIWVEIGKIIYYSFLGEYPPPRKYFFVAPKGISTGLEKLLAKPEKLKLELKKNWQQHCESEITSKVSAPLTGDLLSFFDQFDFAIFSAKSLVELVEGHSKTPFHSVRFGGGLPARPPSAQPPEIIESTESRYIQQIFEAYSDHMQEIIKDVTHIESVPELKNDFLRQRERFYHAESLRNFARDTVPEGTFSALQEDVYQSVIDISESSYQDGLARMRATVAQSAQLPLTSSPLASVTRPQDKQGICHQLANEERLTWVPKK